MKYWMQLTGFLIVSMAALNLGPLGSLGFITSTEGVVVSGVLLGWLYAWLAGPRKPEDRIKIGPRVVDLAILAALIALLMWVFE